MENSGKKWYLQVKTTENSFRLDEYAYFVELRNFLTSAFICVLFLPQSLVLFYKSNILKGKT